jgi:hypothetical protein
LWVIELSTLIDASRGIPLQYSGNACISRSRGPDVRFPKVPALSFLLCADPSSSVLPLLSCFHATPSEAHSHHGAFGGSPPTPHLRHRSRSHSRNESLHLGTESLPAASYSCPQAALPSYWLDAGRYTIGI